MHNTKLTKHKQLPKVSHQNFISEHQMQKAKYKKHTITYQ